MAKQKKYYWIKLYDELLFQDLKLKKLRQLAGGDTYTIIYLKMLLLSKENEGYIYYEGVEPSIAEELALKLDESSGNINVTIGFLEKVGYLIFSEELKQDIYLPQAPTLICSESESAERVRRFRDNQRRALEAKSRKLIGEFDKECALHCNEDVTRCNVDVTNCNDGVTNCNESVTNSNSCVTKCNTDIEIDIDIDKTKLNLINLYKGDMKNEILRIQNNKELMELLKHLSFDFDNERGREIVLNNTSFLIMVYSISEIFKSTDKQLLFKLNYNNIKNIFLKALEALRVSQLDFTDDYDYLEIVSYYIKSIKNYIEEK